MTLNIVPGDAFLLAKPGQAVRHLWVIVTQPEGTRLRAVMVNLTTQRPHSDTTVVLAPGDHPFIRHATVVNYSDARFVEVGRLEAAWESGLFKFERRCDPDVLK